MRMVYTGSRYYVISDKGETLASFTSRQKADQYMAGGVSPVAERRAVLPAPAPAAVSHKSRRSELEWVDPREDWHRGLQLQIYKSMVSEKFFDKAPFGEGRERLDVQLLRAYGPSEFGKIRGKFMFGAGRNRAVKLGGYEDAGIEGDRFHLTPLGVEKSFLRYEDADKLLKRRQEYEEALAVGRSYFYRVVQEPVRAGMLYTVWPMPPGIELPQVFNSEAEAERAAARWEQSMNPLKTGRWWTAPPERYTHQDLAQWLPDYRIFTSEFDMAKYNDLVKTRRNPRRNPDETNWQAVGAKTTSKMVGRKVAVRVAAKTAGKLVPGVGEVLMITEAVPVAMREAKRFGKEYSEELSQAGKTKERIKEKGIVRGTADSAAQAVGGAIKTQWSATKAIGRTGLAAVTARELAEATYYENPRRLAVRNPAAGDADKFMAVLAHLRALQWFYWTSHWTASGPNYYGDHQLLQRLYEGLNESIDSIGERLVAYFGPQSVNPMTVQSMAQKVLMMTTGEQDAMRAALKMELSLRAVIRTAWQANQNTDMSLGLDDFLMALANERDTAIYLLRQRTGVRS